MARIIGPNKNGEHLVMTAASEFRARAWYTTHKGLQDAIKDLVPQEHQYLPNGEWLGDVIPRRAAEYTEKPEQ